MKIQGTVLKVQGVKFAIIIVKPSALDSVSTRNKTRTILQKIFPRIPVILASQNSRGVFRYQGREDVVKFLASIDASKIPWKEYTVL